MNTQIQSLSKWAIALCIAVTVACTHLGTDCEVSCAECYDLEVACQVSGEKVGTPL